MTDLHKPSGKTIDEIKAEHKALFAELDALRIQEPEVTMQLYEALHEVVKAFQKRLQRAMEGQEKQEKFVVPREEFESPEPELPAIQREMADQQQIEKMLQKQEEQWRQQREREYQRVTQATGQDVQEALTQTLRDAGRSPVDEPGLGPGQGPAPVPDKPAIDHDHIEDYIRMRRDKWNKEREKPITSPGDTAYDPGITPSTNLEDEANKLAMRLKDTMDITERLFARIAGMLTDYNRSLESAHNDLTRYRTLAN